MDYNIFEKLLKLNKTTVYRVSKDTGIAASTLSDWKSGRSVPKLDKIKLIADYFDVPLDYMLTGEDGGEQQITSRISYNEIDAVLYFRDTRPTTEIKEVEHELLRACDLYNIPVATNIASAEILICAIDRGDLDWREIVNPRSIYNQSLKAKKV